MSATLAPAAAPESVPATPARWLEPDDGLLLVGLVLCGTMLTGPFGAIPLGIALHRCFRRAQLGTALRPLSVTIVGAFCFIDGCINFIPWSLDLLASHTVIGHTFMTGYGRLFDGAYFLGYNHGALGGSANTTEKMWSLLAVAILMPMRMVAAWAFIQMRRWGLHFMRVTGWLYLMLWVGYTAAMSLDYQQRLGASIYHVPGWWIYNLFYLSPVFAIPYLYTVDERFWRR